ncbi:MarR family transcriptional regulator [Bradyrhizobium sp. AUGA SZCCT0160]|nr:MarR family transcriptional regulator [Bradyrhizobium sp. AUGA SZCCT0160]
MFGHERYGACSRDLILLAGLAGGPLTPHKASEVCGVPRGTAARRLAHLEAKGLVQRRASGAYTLTREAMSRLEAARTARPM